MPERIVSCLFLAVFLFQGFNSRSQQPTDASRLDRPLRIEIPARSIDETYRVIPVDTTGVLLCFRSVETVHDSMTKWYFSLYNKNLHLLWVKSIPVRTGLEFHDYVREKEKITFLFLATDKAKGLTFTETILKLDCRSGIFTGIQNLSINNLGSVRCLVSGDSLFLGYTTKDKASYLQIINLASGKSEFHPLTSSEVISALTSFILDTINNTIYATIRKSVSKTNTECKLLKLNYSGAILSETDIDVVDPGWEIRSPQLILTDPDEILVLAMYAASKGKSSGKSTNLNSTSGFYTCRVKNGIQSDIRFRTFLELNSSGQIIGDKDMMTLRKKAMKKNRAFTEYAPEINVLTHPVICYQDQYIFIGERYIPEYHSENLTEFDFYGRPYINTYSVFDGYNYTVAIIASFDESGNLRWDNSMEIRNLISPELAPRTNVYFSSPGTMVLCYSSEGRIASKIIRGNEVVEKLDFSSIDLMNAEDKMLSDSKNNMMSWFGPYFLCYGYQEIKNINASDKKRLVYYFTKVRFE